MNKQRSISAKKAWVTRQSATYRASRSEREGRTGAPRTGIVDAVIARIRPREADGIDIRLVQLKSGAGGLTGREIARIKDAVNRTSTGWLLAAFDGQTLHLLPEMTERKKVI